MYLSQSPSFIYFKCFLGDRSKMMVKNETVYTSHVHTKHTQQFITRKKQGQSEHLPHNEG